MTTSNEQFFALVEEQLAAGQQVRLTLQGGSMRPTLRDGDTLLIAPPGHTPEVGEVYLFRCSGTHLLHRLVEQNGDICLMQGDHNISTESIHVRDLVARLYSVTRTDGSTLSTDSAEWQRASRKALHRSALRRRMSCWRGAEGRRKLRPWYFLALAILMWAPLNGLGVPLDNYILGLRADHLLHASVYLPCAWILKDLFHRRRWWAWPAAISIGLLTESVQYLLPYRGFDINDMVANTLGVTLGWVIYLCISKHRKRSFSDK